jgi:hypothetical protein
MKKTILALALTALAAAGAGAQTSDDNIPVHYGASTSIAGNAGTASALAADPADCSSGTVALGINAAGTAQCTATPSVTSITGALVGNASTATALAADPADCSASQVATGIAASGALSCTGTPTVASATLNGTGGLGFIHLAAQSSPPATPGEGQNIYGASSGFSWIGVNGFTRTFSAGSITANRTWTLPDVNGTMALKSDDTLSNLTITGLNLGQSSITFSNSPYTVPASATTISCNATAGNVVINLPAASGTGRMIRVKKTDSSANTCVLTRAGSDLIDGTSTATLSSQYASATVEDSGSATWIRTHVNQLGGMLTGSSVSVAQSLTIADDTSLAITGGSVTGSGTTPFVSATGTWNTSANPTAIKLNVTKLASGGTGLLMDLQVGGSSKLLVAESGSLTSTGTLTAGTFTAGGSANIQFNGRGIFTSPAAGTIQLGAANAAAPVAQTLQAQGSRGGTDSDVAGANLTIASGDGTGSSTGSSIIFQTPTAGSTGTTAQTMATRLTLSSAGGVVFGTTANLNGQGMVGARWGILPTTGSTTSTVATSNETYTNTGAAGSVTITLLNDPSFGTWYRFCSTVAQDLIAAPSAGETLYDGGTAYSSIKVNGLANCFTVEALTNGSGAVWAVVSKNGTVTDTP